jgi:tetratricopeptide (TPR) repeat protein
MEKARYIGLVGALPALLFLMGCGSVAGDPLEAGRQAFESNAYGEARIHLKNALEADPRSVEANLLFAKTMLELGDGLTAQTALAKIEPSRSFSVHDLANLKAKALILQDKSNEALALLEDDIDSWDAVSFASAVRASVDMGDIAKGRSYLRDGLERFPEDGELHALDAIILLEQGRITPARAMAAKALEKDGKNLSALLIAGQIEQLSGNKKAAQEFFDRALAAYPDSRIPLLSLAAVRADEGAYDEALALLDRADSLYNLQAISAYLRARIFFEKGDVQSAYNLMQEAEDGLADHPPSLLLAGEVAMKRKNYNQASEKMTRFLGFMPGHVKGTLLLADALDQQGDSAAAAKTLDTITGRADIDPAVLNYAAAIYTKAGQADSAEMMAKRGNVPQNQKLGELATEAGEMLSSGEPAKALSLYEKAVAGGLGNNALIRNNMAYAALQLGQNGKALENARLAYSLTPDDPSVRDTLGWVLLKTGGSRSEAVKHLQFAVGQRQTNIEMRWHLAQALIASGRKAAAKPHIDFIMPFATGSQRAELEKIAAAL